MSRVRAASPESQEKHNIFLASRCYVAVHSRRALSGAHSSLSLTFPSLSLPDSHLLILTLFLSLSVSLLPVPFWRSLLLPPSLPASQGRKTFLSASGEMFPLPPLCHKEIWMRLFCFEAHTATEKSDINLCARSNCHSSHFYLFMILQTSLSLFY